ncbi:MAG TPA: FAD/NAD(P)-binding protein [Sphingobium sp.]
MLSGDHVAIVGGGFSGSLLAINLLRHEGPRTTLIERRARQVARGVAYGTARREHLLNVRATNMSALPDDPDHFIRWLDARGEQGQQGFVGRSIYGAYLAELLDQAMRAAPDRLRMAHAEAIGISDVGAGLRVALRDGGAIVADAVVLAQGNLAPHALSQFAGLDEPFYMADPWAADVAQDLGDTDMVLLIGAGLTAVDVALTLDARGFAGGIVALSRRGLSPRAHAAGGPPPRSLDRPPFSGSALVAHVRRRADELGWRLAVDELRPHTQNIWRSASEEEQRRFLRHLRPYWDVHRHRLAPDVAQRIAAMQADGRLTFAAGRVTRVAATDGALAVAWQPRGASAESRMQVSRIINCTGPQGDLLRTEEPLLKSLVDQGLIRPDRLNLGIDVDQAGRAVRRDGGSDDRLFAVGPMTRGAFWEIVAVPDLRHQSWDLARWLSAAHWVGGEGL